MQKNGTASTLENRFESLKSSVGERAEALKTKAVDVKDAVFENGEKALDRAGQLIKENPFIAIGIAFGVGYLVVRMIRK
jgi:ElaB/YqjD/DUF883 family membrane-anchored ribosome-binding protein